ncbi:HAMP domain-containing histidine kinase [Clostridium estertheticum]|uniref:sensor histidine kinase n=1 Tax=Clostridium estertheticum TaxID=238834 RepID=UPI0013E96D97|nr:HAMP domain-containing sensor histidine kinase [Clostridium estertheticum]MBZ9685191.1 HAMP domain-containing histidine kinase [Clostridium estertheticum]
MNKLNITLKWRFTLLTVILIAISCVAIVTSMNIDIKRTIPTGSLTSSYTENFKAKENGISPALPTGSIDNSQSSTAAIVASEATMAKAVSSIYTGSIITLLIIISLGGISAYLIADKALKPVQVLNENIKNISENNLLANLEVQGPHDEIKELTISFNQMLAKLNNAFTSQKRFNASVAHELKTPLAAMKINIDVLNDGEQKTVEEYKETLDIVEKSVGKMNSMIETLLDLVREENTSLDDQVYVVNIIEDVVEDLTIIAETNHIALDFKILTSVSSIKGNEVLLYRAIYNVVENSIKYNKLNGKVTVNCEQEKDTIRIEIKDTGKGIPIEEINNIFEPFYRVDRFNVNSSNGMGLGLSLTKSTITIHGGEIKVYSEPDRGTRVTISLPVI